MQVRVQPMKPLIRSLTFAAMAAVTPAAWAVDFQWGDDLSLTWQNRFSVGGAWRMEDRDPDMIGKLNLNPSLCDGHDCRSFSGNTEPNQRLVDAPGGLAAHNLDNGNLNYDQHDMVFATARLLTDLTFSWDKAVFRLRGQGIFDEVNTDFTEKHPNTRFQPAETPRSDRIEKQVGKRLDLLEGYVTYPLTVGDRVFTLSLGEQRIRWGEANTIALNSVGEINPPDQNQLFFPGIEIADVFLPVGLATLSTDLAENLALDLIYQYRWRPIRPAAAGSFLSTSDIAGGGDSANISEGQFPEDPNFIGTPQGTFGLISSTSSSVPILPERFGAPRDGGQYGIRLSGYLPEFQNGTEWALYYLNYHSRLPYGSVISTEESCWRDSANFAEAFVDCRGFNGSTLAVTPPGSTTPIMLPTPPGLPVPPGVEPVADAVAPCTEPRRRGAVNPTGVGCEPVPLDTLGVFLDYPEDIHMFGVSFNTTVGLWSLAGEYSFRPNLPLQVQLQDVVFAGVNPIFPRSELEIPGVASIPTAEIAAPDYIETRYRGNTNIQPNTIIRGYERMKVGQLSLTGIRVLSRTGNPIGADQVLILVEGGFTHVLDMPDLEELQFDGSGADNTHFSPGADGSGSDVVDTRRTVPTMQTDGFADDFSAGYRVLMRAEYNDVADWLPVVRPLLGFFHDVKGISPSPMQNFIEGRLQLSIGSSFEFNQNLSGLVLYTAFDGGGDQNKLSDRDFLSMNLAYSF